MSFINDLAPAAQAVGKKYNILPSLILAQACLESDYGQSQLAVQGKNLFGIKGIYQGQCVSFPTSEYENNQWVQVTAPFRKYPTWEESLEDLALLYCNGVSWDRAKYHNIIGEKDINKAVTYPGQDGYCTDPSYSSKLLSIVHQYNLTQYDEHPAEVSYTPAGVYTVQPGDTLIHICEKLYPGKNPAITMPWVVQANHIQDPNKIYVGQRLSYPAN